jgi:hypothetical protein
VGAARVDDAALLGALAAFRRLEPEVRKETARAVRSTLTPLWRNIVATRVRVAEGTISGRMDALAGPGSAGFSASGRGTLRAFTSSKRLSGGLGNDQWWAVEFGTVKPGWSGTRLPRRFPKGRIGYRGVTSWAPAAARVYLAVLTDVLRTIPGAEDA